MSYNGMNVISGSIGSVLIVEKNYKKINRLMEEL